MAPPPWSLFDVASHLGQVVQRMEDELRLEQAVHGLDAKDEAWVQDAWAVGLKPWFETAREVHYPSSVGRKLSHRPRCDLVLSPTGRPLHGPSPCPAEEALWIEIKTARQFRTPGVREPGYAPRFRTVILDDARKLAGDPRILHAGLALLVFSETEAMLTKDMDLFESVLIQGQVMFGSRQIRSIATVDRVGHRVAGVALWPL